MFVKSIIKIISVFFNLIFMVKCQYQHQQILTPNDRYIMQNYQLKEDLAVNNNNNQFSDISESKLTEEEFQKLFVKILQEKIESDSLIIPNRVKKGKFKQSNHDFSTDSESETEPLANHRRKTFVDTDELASKIDNSKKKQFCSTNMLIEPNKIIDTKNSVANGAILISIEMVNPKSISSNINELQESCMDLCCNSDECDSSLLSLKSGNEGYRCYLFKCSGKCLYVNHKDYIVIREKSGDQINPNTIKNTEIKTGESPPEKTRCNPKYEFTCVKSRKCIAIYDACDGIDHCEDKSDEFNCTNNDEKVIQNYDMYNVNAPKQLDNDNFVKKKPIIQTDENTPLDNSISLDDDYDEFKLLKEQSLIVDHLKELENQLFLNEKKPKVVFETPKGYLDSFMKPNKHLLSKELLDKKNYTKKNTTTSAKLSTMKAKIFFHDNHDDSLLSVSISTTQNIVKISNNVLKTDDAIYFNNKDTSFSSSSSILMAIIILILGISMMIGCFGYLVLSTRYVTKRFKWLKQIKQQNQNVDVDGDYLINGMYL